jgi:hypothetical protein
MPPEIEGRTEGEELVPEDDAVIGRAFRWSIAVILVLAVAAVAGYALLRLGPEPEAVRAKDVGAIEGLAAAAPTMPAVRWTDVTAQAGLVFAHTSGARGEKLLPETMGGGVAFFDHDGDGDSDLLFVNGVDWPWTRDGRRPPQALYRNEGGRFVDATSEAGLDLALYGMGVAAGDYDNDGDQDLFLSALGPNRLLRNEGGRFSDVTESAGVAGGDDTWSTSAGFLDHDRDGDLDLFVCNYVRWSREIDIELNFTLNGTDRAYGPPTNYEGVHPYLYRNEGDGTFSDVSAAAGIQVVNPLNGKPVSKALAATFADVDSDGWIDIVVANDTVQNFLYHNRGDGTFEEIGASAGIAFDGAGNATGAMGIDAARYRNDRAFAVAIGNFANEMTSFFVSQNSGLLFTDEAAGEGIGSPSRLFLKFGLFFFDYDLDGRVDLLQANGHLEDEIHEVQASQHYEQPAQLFWNQGPEARSCYVEVPREQAGDLSKPIVGRGAAYADYDGDGDLDVVLTQTGGRPLLLRNDQALGHRWLRVALEGRSSNRDAIGAWVVLSAGGIEQRRQVMPTRSYLSQVEPVVTFGLGQAATIDSLEVIWPDGHRQAVTPPGVDRAIRVVEDSARSL